MFYLVIISDATKEFLPGNKIDLLTELNGMESSLLLLVVVIVVAVVVFLSCSP